MYINYDDVGNIIRQVSVDDSYFNNTLYVEGNTFLDDLVLYVDINSKNILPKQDYTLENLPLPCTITIEGVSYEVTEQPTFEFDVAGEYIIEVDAGVEYLKKEFKYVVEA